jgi:hypothetical protein
MAVLKVETDIIRRAEILVIMYVEIYKTGIIIFIGDVTLTDNFQYQNQFLHMWVTNQPNIFVDQGQFSDTDFISGTHQRKNIPFADQWFSYHFLSNRLISVILWWSVLLVEEPGVTLRKPPTCRKYDFLKLCYVQFILVTTC